VRLSNGTVGVVLRQERGLNNRPVVRVIADRKHELIDPYDLELAREPQIEIVAVLPDYPERIKEQLKTASP